MTREATIERVGGYRVVRKLATGGTSDVLLAKAEGPHGFERTVVLKLLLAQFHNNEDLAQMFAREASAYARLSHSAIVQLFDFFAIPKAGEPGSVERSSEAAGRGGQLCMVLEHVDGPALSRLRSMLKAVGRDLDDRAAIYVASRIFEALAAAHSALDESGNPAAVIHRDVNPSNVLVPWDGQVKLADFGVAKLTGANQQSVAGMIKGTYGYMSPEQVTGDPVTPRADVYAGGIVLWELLAKRRAFQRGALPEIEALRAMAEPRLVSLDTVRPDVDRAVRDALTRALEPHADRRSITAEEMVTILRASVPAEQGRELLATALGAVRHNPQAARISQSVPPVTTPSLTPRPPTSLAPRVMETTPRPPAAVPRPGGDGVTPKPGVSARPTAVPVGSAPPLDLTPRTATARLAAVNLPGMPPTPVTPSRPVSIFSLVDPPAAPGLRHEATGADPNDNSSAALALKDAIDEVLRGQPSSMPPSLMLQSERPRNVVVPPPGAHRDREKPELPYLGPNQDETGTTLVLPRAQAKLGTLPPSPAPMNVGAPSDFAAAVREVENAEALTVAPPAGAPQTARMLDAPMHTLPMDARPAGPISESQLETHVQPARVAAPAMPSAPPPRNEAYSPGESGQHRASMPPARSGARVAAVVVSLLIGILAGATSLVFLLRYKKDLPTVPPSTSVVATSAPKTSASVAPVASIAPPASAPESTPPVVTSASVAPSASEALLASVASSAAAPPTTPTPSASVAPSASAAPTASAPSADLADGMGVVKTAGAAPGRRIFVDEKVLGQTPESVTVKCGAHMVRLGSSGKPQKIDVPCNGEILVGDKPKD